MGCKEDTAIKRQKLKTYGELHYWIFDIWAWGGVSFLDTPYKDRIQFMEEQLSMYVGNNPYVELASFFYKEDIIDNLNRVLSEGGEGLVITRLDSHPEPGKRPARKTLKVKKELQDTIDVVICGVVQPTRLYNGKSPETWQYWMNDRTNELKNECMYGKAQVQHEAQEKTERGVGIDTWVPVTKKFFYGWAAGFDIGLYKDGKLVKVGQVSGLTDDVAEHWRDYLGTVLEITCMEVLDTGGLRHPRIMSYRNDKPATDCKWEDVFRKE